MIAPQHKSVTGNIQMAFHRPIKLSLTIIILKENVVWFSDSYSRVLRTFHFYKKCIISKYTAEGKDGINRCNITLFLYQDLEFPRNMSWTLLCAMVWGEILLFVWSIFGLLTIIVKLSFPNDFEPNTIYSNASKRGKMCATLTFI